MTNLGVAEREGQDREKQEHPEDGPLEQSERPSAGDDGAEGVQFTCASG